MTFLFTEIYGPELKDTGICTVSYTDGFKDGKKCMVAPLCGSWHGTNYTNEEE
jgi:hypothetical protein